MALEKVKLNWLQQWAQSLEDEFNGVIVLADFLATEWTERHDDKDEPMRFLLNLLESDLPAYKAARKYIYGSLSFEDGRVYLEARETAIKCYKNKKQFDAAETKMLKDFICEIFDHAGLAIYGR